MFKFIKSKYNNCIIFLFLSKNVELTWYNYKGLKHTTLLIIRQTKPWKKHGSRPMTDVNQITQRMTDGPKVLAAIPAE